MSWLSRLFGRERAARVARVAHVPHVIGGAPAPATLELYTRDGCHLCDEMKAALAAAALGERATLREIDIAGDPELEQRFGRSIPVLAIDGRVAFKGRLTPDELRAKLARYAREAEREHAAREHEAARDTDRGRRAADGVGRVLDERGGAR